MLRKAKKLKRKIIKHNGLKVGESTPLCPKCNQGLTTKWGHWQRTARYFFGKPKTISVQRYYCSECRVTFGVLPKIIDKFRRFAKKAFRDMVDMKLWFSSSYRKITKWDRIHGSSPTTLWKEIQVFGKKCRDAFVDLNCKFSGSVCIDEVWIRRWKGEYVYVFAAVDAQYGHVIWIDAYTVEYKGDKSLATKQFLQELKAQGYQPQVIITDGDRCYPKAIKTVFPNAKHQSCILHLKWNIIEKFRTKRKLKLSPELEELLKMVLSLFDVDTDKDEAVGFLKTALEAALQLKAPSRIITCLKDLIARTNKLFGYLELGSPKSNSWVESLFSFFEPAQVISRNIPNVDSVRNLFTAAALHYNFTPKDKSKFGESVPIRRAGYRGPCSIYDFVDYAV